MANPVTPEQLAELKRQEALKAAGAALSEQVEKKKSGGGFGDVLGDIALGLAAPFTGGASLLGTSGVRDDVGKALGAIGGAIASPFESKLGDDSINQVKERFKGATKGPDGQWRMPDGSPVPAQFTEILDFDEGKQEADLSMATRGLLGDAATNARTLGQQVTEQAGQDVKFGASADTSGIEERARAAGDWANTLAGRATGPQEFDRLSGVAEQRNRALEAAGSFGGRIDSSLSGMAGDLQGFRGDMGGLRDAAAGLTPSQAEALARAQLDANARNMAGMAAGARGGNLAASIRSAAEQGRIQGLQSANQLAALRAQEMATARGQLLQGNQGLSSAGGALAGLTQGAQGLETQRQTAAAGAAGQLASTAGGMESSRLSALGQAGQQATGAVSAESQARGVGGQIASAKAQALEEARRRALELYKVQAGITTQHDEAAAAQRRAAQAGQVSPATAFGSVVDAGGQFASMAAG